MMYARFALGSVPLGGSIGPKPCTSCSANLIITELPQLYNNKLIGLKKGKAIRQLE